MEEVQNNNVDLGAQMPSVVVVSDTSIPKKKSFIPLALLVVGIVALLGVAYVFRDALFLRTNQEGAVTPTPKPKSTLTLIGAVTPITAEVGRAFTYQIRVKEFLTTPTFFVSQLDGATVSSTGLITWTPSVEGVFTGKMKVVDVDAEGELELTITVAKQTVTVVDKFVISEALVLPKYPIFYVLNAKDIRQLWVMNNDGSEQKYTGVQYVEGSFENVPNYGGVLYTVNQTNGKETLNVYYYSTITGKTTIIKHKAPGKGYTAQVSNPSISPSLEYIVYSVSVNKNGTMGDDTSYYAYSLTEQQSKLIPESPSISLLWSLLPNSIFLARDNGLLAINVWTGEKVQVADHTTSIPSEGDYFDVSNNETLELLGSPELGSKLVLTKGGVSNDVATSSWGELQPFFCASPDAKLVLFEQAVYEDSQSYTGINAVNIETGVVTGVSPGRVAKEAYSLSGCIWTSSHTVIIQKYTDAYDSSADIYLVEVDVTNNSIRQVTSSGKASLEYPY